MSPSSFRARRSETPRSAASLTRAPGRLGGEDPLLDQRLEEVGLGQAVPLDDHLALGEEEGPFRFLGPADDEPPGRLLLPQAEEDAGERRFVERAFGYDLGHAAILVGGSQSVYSRLPGSRSGRDFPQRENGPRARASSHAVEEPGPLAGLAGAGSPALRISERKPFYAPTSTNPAGTSFPIRFATPPGPRSLIVKASVGRLTLSRPIGGRWAKFRRSRPRQDSPSVERSV